MFTRNVVVGTKPMYNLGNINTNYLYTGKSGVNSTVEILHGRPSGGVSISYKKSIAKYIKCVQIASTRVCGVILQASCNFSVLVFCVFICHAIFIPMYILMMISAKS